MTHRDKDVQKLLDEYGFRVVRESGKHYVCQHPTGAIVVVSKSPNFCGGSFLKNVRGDLRRATRRVTCLV